MYAPRKTKTTNNLKAEREYIALTENGRLSQRVPRTRHFLQTYIQRIDFCRKRNLLTITQNFFFSILTVYHSLLPLIAF